MFKQLEFNRYEFSEWKTQYGKKIATGNIAALLELYCKENKNLNLLCFYGHNGNSLYSSKIPLKEKSAKEIKKIIIKKYKEMKKENFCISTLRMEE